MTALPPVLSVENPERRLIQTAFLPAKLDDNPILEKRDPTYRDRLFQSGEKLAAAMLEGDWSTFQGQFLPKFQYNRHVCKDFEIPREWPKWRGYDWGYAAPACMLWFAKNPDNHRVFLYNEFYEAGLTDPRQAEMIASMSGNEKYMFSFADPSVWTKRTTEIAARSTYDVFLEYGVVLTKADNDQIRKAKRIRTALANIHDKEPGMKIFASCKNAIREIGNLMLDPDHPEKPLPGQEDHAYDACCYGLTRYRPPMLTARKYRETKSAGPLTAVEGL